MKSVILKNVISVSLMLGAAMLTSDAMAVDYKEAPVGKVAARCSQWAFIGGNKGLASFHSEKAHKSITARDANDQKMWASGYAQGLRNENETIEQAAQRIYKILCAFNNQSKALNNDSNN